MQSQSPCIIKHFIPLQFSKAAVDSPSKPKKMTSAPKKDNPLKNLKLRRLQQQPDPQFVLTFHNQSNPHYQPRRALKYRKLFQKLTQQNTKRQLMMAEVQVNQGKDLKIQTRQRPKTMSVRTRQKMQKKEKDQVDWFQPRPIFSSSLLRNIHSSSTGRLVKASTTREHSLRNEEEEEYTPMTLKIRGSRAPNKEMVDHLKRNSLKELKRLQFQ